jgi:putative transposase
MAASHTRLIFHVVFSTKGRKPWIAPDVIERLHGYLAESARRVGAIHCLAGGVADHIHLVLGLPADVPLSGVVREIKKAGTAWIRGNLDIRDFQWQGGYFAVTVSPSGFEDVCKYVRTQAEHHSSQDYRTEYLALLRKCGIQAEDRDLRWACGAGDEPSGAEPEEDDGEDSEKSGPGA